MRGLYSEAHADLTVDLTSHEAVDFWCRALDATPNQLAQAVKTVGPNPRAVQQYVIKARAGDARDDDPYGMDG